MRPTAEPLRTPGEDSGRFGAPPPPPEIPDATTDVDIVVPMTPSSSRAVSGRAALQIVMVWGGQILGYRLLKHRARLTIGPHKRAPLVTRAVLGGGRGRFKLAVPKGQGYLLRVAPGMRGDVHAGGLAMPVTDILAGPAPAKRRAGDVREIALAPGDRARIVLDERSD